MLRKKVSRYLTIVTLGLLIVACAGTLPIEDVQGVAVTTGTGRPPSLDAMQRAIIRAGSNLKFRMTVVAPGVVNATYEPRGDFVAVMEITFNPRSYSIKYKSSDRLEYDAEKRTIHKSYNTWVKNLQRGIDNELMAL